MILRWSEELARTVQQVRRNICNGWTLTQSEMALFIAAVTFLAGGFCLQQAADCRRGPRSRIAEPGVADVSRPPIG